MSKLEQHRNESGEWHRVGGPAVIYSDGLNLWCRHGKRHRRGGPAFFYPDGGKFWLWCVNGRHLPAPKKLPGAAHPIMELFL